MRDVSLKHKIYLLYIKLRIFLLKRYIKVKLIEINKTGTGLIFGSFQATIQSKEQRVTKIYLRLIGSSQKLSKWYAPLTVGVSVANEITKELHHFQKFPTTINDQKRTIGLMIG